MDLSEYLTSANDIERDGTAAFQSATTLDELEAARIAYLGDRQGKVKTLQDGLRALAKEDKPAAGKGFNDARTHLESAYADRKAALERDRSSERPGDRSLPARRQWRGAKHPVTLVIEE